MCPAATDLSCVCLSVRAAVRRVSGSFTTEQVIARVRELVAGIWEEAKVEMYGSCFTGACVACACAILFSFLRFSCAGRGRRMKTCTSSLAAASEL